MNDCINNEESVFNIFYGAKNFTYDEDDGLYTVKNLLKIGFLHCQHHCEDTQAIDMWHLINPELEDTVSNEDVIQFLEDLIFISVDMMKKFLATLHGDKEN